VVSRTPNGAAFSGQTAVQLREIMAQKIFLMPAFLHCRFRLMLQKDPESKSVCD
jgi:hypothetical protein